MGRVRLHDHRAAGRQRRSGVPAQHREREREIAGREHGDGPHGHANAGEVRPAGRWRAGHRGVVHHRVRRTPLQLGGEAAQLEGGAIQFPVQAGRAQGGLAVGDGHQGFALRFQGVGQGAQQARAVGGAARGESVCRLCSGGHGSVDGGRRGGVPGVAPGLAGARVDGLQGVGRGHGMSPGKRAWAEGRAGSSGKAGAVSRDGQRVRKSCRGDRSQRPWRRRPGAVTVAGSTTI